MEFNTDEQVIENSAFSSDDSDYGNKHRIRKKKVKPQRPKSIEVIVENIPPKRNNENNNRNNIYSNTSTLIHLYDNNLPPAKHLHDNPKKKSFFSKLFCWKKRKNEVVTLSKEDKKKLKKKKEKRNCCLITVLIIIIILLLGNIAALDVAYIAYRNSPLSNITTLVNNATDAQEQNFKSTMCSTLLGATTPLDYNCDFCWDNNSSYNVTSFCWLKSLYINAFNQTLFNNGGWLRDIEYCRWFGIKCDSSNNIIEIRFTAPLIPRVFDSRVGKVKTLQKITLFGGGGKEALPTNVIPAGMFAMENLQTLEITSTGFIGKIPNTFDKMTSLKTFRLVDNRQLTNPMPDSISSTSLTTLVYAMQNLTGAIPDFIGNSPTLQQSLRFLDLSGNQFTGNIPDSLMKLTNITSLSFADNLLTGEFPISITTSKFAKIITFLNLNTNGFTGILPPAIIQCENLKLIDLTKNSLSGPIPAELARINLTNIILSNNQFTGTIPESLGNLNLSRLFLSGNQLTGTVPNNICQRKYSFCELAGNKIPFQACVTCSV